MSLVPFGDLYFFLLSLCVVFFVHLGKNKLRKVISYNRLIFFITILYFVLFFQAKYINAMLIGVIYTYFVYRISIWKNNINPLLFSLIVAIPMFMYKLGVGDFYRVIGISYITIRTIQMIVDYKNYGKLSFIDFTTFIIYPPSLLAGPIDRSYRFEEDLNNGYENLNSKNILVGWKLLLMGVGLKFILGDLTQLKWLSQINIESSAIVDMINSAYSYSFYLFFDFAGYSAMAVGLSTMFGITLPMNFNKPYLAENPQVFWRRFHISLGSWLTDYIFKPLYKNLSSIKILRGRRLLNQNIAIFSTFFLMGVWNGLTWYYIMSGALFGFYSVIHNCYVMYIRRGGKDYFELLPFPTYFKRFLMINFAVLSLYFFSGRVPI